MGLPLACRWPLLLVTSLLVVCSCTPSADIEPVPSPLVNLRFSTLASDAGWVTVVAEPESVVPETAVALRDERSGAVTVTVAAADGSFSLSVPAARGDELRVTAEGYEDVRHTAAAPAPGAPPVPGDAGVAGPDDEGRFWVTCGVGCLADPEGLVAYAAGTRGGLLGRAAVELSGAFALPVRGDPGDTLFVFAARGEVAGPNRTVTLPLGVDADDDGFDASVDCDDSDGAVRPDAEETCNDLDDDCDGEVDEGCEGPPCRPDGTCPGSLTCEPTLGVCRSANATDRDGDGVPRAEDVCPNTPDPDQRDRDGDGKGDACDNDADGDLSPGPVDCDDADPRRGHNFAEICGDGVDNDCDGAVDGGC